MNAELSNVIEFRPGDSTRPARTASRSNDRGTAADAGVLALDVPLGGKNIDGLRRRIFWTTHGWFLRLRDDDVARSRGLTFPPI